MISLIIFAINRVLIFWIFISFHPSSEIILMTFGRGDYAWSPSSYIAVKVYIGLIGRLALIEMIWSDVVSRMRRGYSSLLHHLFFQHLIFLCFQLHLLVKESLRSDWSDMLPSPRSHSFLAFALLSLGIVLLAHFILFFLKFTNVFHSFILFLWVQRAVWNFYDRVLFLEIIFFACCWWGPLEDSAGWFAIFFDDLLKLTLFKPTKALWLFSVCLTDKVIMTIFF